MVALVSEGGPQSVELTPIGQLRYEADVLLESGGCVLLRVGLRVEYRHDILAGRRQSGHALCSRQRPRLGPARDYTTTQRGSIVLGHPRESSHINGVMSLSVITTGIPMCEAHDVYTVHLATASSMSNLTRAAS